jgi:hypothetical protein
MSWPLRTLGTAAAPLPTWGGIPKRDATANSIALPQAKSTRPRRRGLGAETRPRPLAAAGSGVPRSDPTPSGGARAPAASDRARWGREPRSPRRGGGSRAGERGGWGANGERTSPAAATGSSVPPPPSAVGAVVARRLGRRLRKLGSFFVFSFFPRRISLRLWVVGLLNTTRFLFFFSLFFITTSIQLRRKRLRSQRSIKRGAPARPVGPAPPLRRRPPASRRRAAVGLAVRPGVDGRARLLRYFRLARRVRVGPLGTEQRGPCSAVCSRPSAPTHRARAMIYPFLLKKNKINY